LLVYFFWEKLVKILKSQLRKKTLNFLNPNENMQVNPLQKVAPTVLCIVCEIFPKHRNGATTCFYSKKNLHMWRKLKLEQVICELQIAALKQILECTKAGFRCAHIYSMILRRTN
jgi:hypothetical protein